MVIPGEFCRLTAACLAINSSSTTAAAAMHLEDTMCCVSGCSFLFLDVNVQLWCSVARD
jgi:hypothetical protein